MPHDFRVYGHLAGLDPDRLAACAAHLAAYECAAQGSVLDFLHEGGFVDVDSDLDGVNISPDRLNLAASYVGGPFSARVQTQVYFKRRFDGKARAADDANPNHPQKLADNDFGGYTLTDATVRYQTGIGGISLSIQNLFNRQYIDYSSDTRLPTDQLSYFAGRGRTFTLGWDYRF